MAPPGKDGRAARCLMVLFVLMAVECAVDKDKFIRMNHLQTLHAHNSYHSCPLPNMVALFTSPTAAGALSGAGLNPTFLQYGHEPLLTLIKDRGVRSIELDLYFDPAGGRYSLRAGPKLAAVLRAWPNTTGMVGGPELLKKGSKVLHILDFDFQSTCDSVVSCLAPIAAWSKANPTHTPLHVLFEIKTWDPNALLGPSTVGLVTQLLNALPGGPTNLSSTPTPDPSHLKTLQGEILSVFDKSQVFTPDMFREGYPTLQARIKKEGWPTLAALRGKTVFRVLSFGVYSQLMESLWPGGKGGILFRETAIGSVPYTPGNNTVFGSVDFFLGGIPATNGSANSTVANGYYAAVAQLVKTNKIMLRASGDVDTIQARANFHGYAAAAAAGGAHFVHTDYPNGETSTCGFTSPYTVYLTQIKKGSWNNITLSSVNTTKWGKTNSYRLASVCNPVSAPVPCSKWGKAGQPGAGCPCYSQL